METNTEKTDKDRIESKPNSSLRNPPSCITFQNQKKKIQKYKRGKAPQSLWITGKTGPKNSTPIIVAHLETRFITIMIYRITLLTSLLWKKEITQVSATRLLKRNGIKGKLYITCTSSKLLEKGDRSPHCYLSKRPRCTQSNRPIIAGEVEKEVQIQLCGLPKRANNMKSYNFLSRDKKFKKTEFKGQAYRIEPGNGICSKFLPLNQNKL